MKLTQGNEPWLDTVSDNWPASRIRNVAQLSPGYSDGPPKKDEVCTVVPMELLSETGTIDTTSLQAFEDVTEGLTLFEAGDVLFAKITPCMENGKRAFVDNLPTRYAFGSTEFHVLRPSHAVNTKFPYYYTFNPIYRAYAAKNISGAAGQKLVKSLEQQRNAKRRSLFDAQDEIDRQRERLIAEIEGKLQQRTSLTELFRVRWKLV